ncbi:TetR/AcrR family transcriptional regulator [Streptomyces sp. NPDC088789]|uniref:TetR/AcrR family transcriptional regulator n=1 Tax=Streptomyces sp. NPDC088789 TaxID=3365899 RepID=UPI00380D8CD2
MAFTETQVTSSRGRLDKRRAILDAALRVFGEVGYAGATIDAIAAEAGVAKPTIYNHLGGKENLFHAVMLDAAADWHTKPLAAVRSLPAKPGDLQAELLRIGYQLVECMRSEHAWKMRRLLDSEVARFPELYEEVQLRGSAEVLDTLAGRLALVANGGLLDLPDPTRAASQFMALISDRLALLAAMGTRPLSQSVVDSTVTSGVETFLRAFAAR